MKLKQVFLIITSLLVLIACIAGFVYILINNSADILHFDENASLVLTPRPGDTYKLMLETNTQPTQTQLQNAATTMTLKSTGADFSTIDSLGAYQTIFSTPSKSTHRASLADIFFTDYEPTTLTITQPSTTTGTIVLRHDPTMPAGPFALLFVLPVLALAATLCFITTLVLSIVAFFAKNDPVI